jgi:hypothetical protein
MGGVHDRRSRPTKPFDSQRLARLTEDVESAQAAPDEDEDEALKEWGVEPVVEFELADQPASHPHVVSQPTPPGGSRLAKGTTPANEVRTAPAGPRAAAGTNPPGELRARTATVHDPLTTSLLAEVARRAQTIDMMPIEDETKSEPNEGEAPRSPRNRRR